MSILADCHLHSSHSGDSETPMEQTIQAAIKKGLTHVCFTEHMDFDFPEKFLSIPGTFEVNTDSYLYELLQLRAKYESQIKVLFGIELGMQPGSVRKNLKYVKSYDFDFVIASSHLCHGVDPYYQVFYEGRSEQEAYREYFESILENIKVYQQFDVYGHLDYVVRYGPNKDHNYSYAQYQDIIDEILKTLIENEKGIEINTAGLNKGLKDVHPCTDIIKRYKELGGDIITIGSDSHVPDTVASHFDKAAEILKACGFKYYCVFESRYPEYFKI